MITRRRRIVWGFFFLFATVCSVSVEDLRGQPISVCDALAEWPPYSYFARFGGGVVCVVLLLSLFISGLEADELEDLIQIYGSLRPEVIGRFPESGDPIRRMDDGYSRVGIKGRAALSENLTGFYKYERRVSANDGQDDGAVRSDHNELRQVHVGLEGNFGSISIGRHYGLYYDYIDDELDRHRSHYSDAIVFGDLFVSNALVYSSPDLGGINFGVLVELNDADRQGKSIDERFEIAGTFRHQGFAVHAGYVNSPFHSGLFGVASSYGYRSVKFSGIYQRLQKLNQEDDTLVSGAVDVDLSEHNSIRLALTRKQNNMNINPDETYILVGGDHKFSKHFLAFVEFFSKSTEVAQPSDESALVAGFRFDF